MILAREQGVLHYEAYGSGDPVLFLNGFASGISNWYPVIRDLKQTHECVLFDYAGTGESAPPARGRFGLDGYRGEIDALAAALGLERFHLVGYSMGGWIAQEYAAREPGRVLSLALINSSARVSPHQHAVISHFMDVLRDSDFEVFSRLMFASYYSPAYFEKNQADLGRRLRLASLAFARHSPGNWRGLLESFLGFDARPKLAGIACPCLLVSGAQDFLCPREATAELAACLPGALRIEMESVGHALPMERHRELRSALAGFLATTAETAHPRSIP